MGHPVRFDGGHKLDRYLHDALGRYVDYAPVCPEAECGMGVPREAMRRKRDKNAPRLVTRSTRKDKTDMIMGMRIRNHGWHRACLMHCFKT